MDTLRLKLILAVAGVAITLPDLAAGSDGGKPLVVVISGFKSDASESQLTGRAPRGTGNSGMYQLVGDLKKTGVDAVFFNWNGTPAGEFAKREARGANGIVDFIRQRSAKNRFSHLILVGHSWGGHTAIEIAKLLQDTPSIQVALVVGVDACSLSRGNRPEKLPKSVQLFVNYHTRNAFVWGDWRVSERIENVDLGDPKNKFKAKNGSNYASPLDIAAHNAAEWDDRIHKEIIQRIEKTHANQKDNSKP